MQYLPGPQATAQLPRDTLTRACRDAVDFGDVVDRLASGPFRRVQLEPVDGRVQAAAVRPFAIEETCPAIAKGDTAKRECSLTRRDETRPNAVAGQLGRSRGFRVAFDRQLFARSQHDLGKGVERLPAGTVEEHDMPAIAASIEDGLQPDVGPFPSPVGRASLPADGRREDRARRSDDVVGRILGRVESEFVLTVGDAVPRVLVRVAHEGYATVAGNSERGHPPQAAGCGNQGQADSLSSRRHHRRKPWPPDRAPQRPAHPPAARLHHHCAPSASLPLRSPMSKGPFLFVFDAEKGANLGGLYSLVSTCDVPTNNARRARRRADPGPTIPANCGTPTSRAQHSRRHGLRSHRPSKPWPRRPPRTPPSC